MNIIYSVEMTRLELQRNARGYANISNTANHVRPHARKFNQGGCKNSTWYREQVTNILEWKSKKKKKSSSNKHQWKWMTKYLSFTVYLTFLLMTNLKKMQKSWATCQWREIKVKNEVKKNDRMNAATNKIYETRVTDKENGRWEGL